MILVRVVGTVVASQKTTGFPEESIFLSAPVTFEAEKIEKLLWLWTLWGVE